jgi:hypothetical protein
MAVINVTINEHLTNAIALVAGHIEVCSCASLSVGFAVPIPMIRELVTPYLIQVMPCTASIWLHLHAK